MDQLEKTVKQSIFVRIMDVLTHRIKTKVIFFEIVIILFVALSLGLATTFYMQYTLTQKAHQFSERIMKDLAKSIEYNYISLPATDEAVKSYSETPGILYLGYQGFIMTGGEPSKTHLYIGHPIDFRYLRQLEPQLKDLQNFRISKTDVLFSINNEDIPAFEYYMPVFVGSGTVNKRLGSIVLRYSKQIIINEINTVRILIAIITLIIIILGIYISIRGSNSIVRPIVQLTDTVRRFGKGDMSVRINMPVKDEIGMLAKSFDEMIVSIREKLEMQKFVSGSTIKMIQSTVADNPSALQKERHTERKEVTLFFSDIRGFTSMSEKLDPQEVVDILNEYLDAQSNIIHQCNGDIDKFVGDEIVAVFDSETMCQQAVDAACRAQIKIKELNEKRVAKGLFPIEVGIGINMGLVVLGSIGSHDRMDFTVIGDHVNLAARLCSAAGKGEIIVSRNVCECLTLEKDRLIPLDPIVVKGKAKPIEVFKVAY